MGGQPSALIVGQTQTFLSDLLAQDSIFLIEVFDHMLLAALDPTGQSSDDELKQHAVHRAEHTGKLGRSLSMPMPAVWGESVVIFSDPVLAPDGVLTSSRLTLWR
jgi:hypothetical protein